MEAQMWKCIACQWYLWTGYCQAVMKLDLHDTARSAGEDIAVSVPVET